MLHTALTGKSKEKPTPFSVNVMRSQVLYQAAQGLPSDLLA